MQNNIQIDEKQTTKVSLYKGLIVVFSSV